MDNEKYGIELELILNKFNSQVQKVQKTTKELKDVQMNLKLAPDTAQMKYIKSQIEEIQYLLNKADKGFEVGDTLKLEAQLERLTNQYEKLSQKQNKIITSQFDTALQKTSNQLNNVSKEANKATNNFDKFTTANMSKGLDKMISKIRRFGLSLLSIRSIWALVSRASSAYLSQDTALANRLQSVWTGLGALLAPIIEGIVNILAKAIKYIAIFIKALTGVDLLARAAAKSMKGAAGSAKALNKALAGFDELTNLDTDAGGGTGGIGLGGLEDVDIDMEWAERIEKFGEWVRKNKETVLGFLSGLTLALIGLKTGIKGFGMAGGIISLLSLMIQGAKTLDEKYHIDEKMWRGIYEKYGFDYDKDSSDFEKWKTRIIIGGKMIGEAWERVKETFSNWTDLANKMIQKGRDVIEGFLKGILDVFKNIGNWLKENILDPFINWFKRLFGISSPSKVMAEMGKYIVDGLYEGIKNIWDKTKSVFENLKTNILNVFTSLWNDVKSTFISVWNWILSAFSKGGQIFNGVKEGISDIFKKAVNGVISGINKVLSSALGKLNTILNKIKSIKIFNLKPFDGMWSWNPISIPQIPQLAVGTNYVPEDQLAMIHKGEAVIPKKFNSQEYFNGSDDETKELLRELISKVEGIEINPYTTIRDVGKASLSYINNKSRQLGESVVV